jgi:CheY-like chemotaxis protein
MYRLKALVVDHEQSSRNATRRLLLDAGYDVMTLDSGFGATRALVRGVVDVVVLDINLPAMPSDKLIGMWRSHEKLQTVLVVAITDGGIAAATEAQRVEGADLVIQKSQLQASLIQKLGELVQLRIAEIRDRKRLKPNITNVADQNEE